jgi:hypothetical protein
MSEGGSKTVLTVPKRRFRLTPIDGHRQTGAVGPVRANRPYPITSPPLGEKSRRQHDAERSDCLQVPLIGQSSLNARIQKFRSKFGRSHPAWGDVVGTAPLGAQT